MSQQHQPMVEIDTEERGRRIALVLQQIKESKDKSIPGLAEYAGVSSQAAYRWKDGKITKENLSKLAHYSGVDISYFYYTSSNSAARTSQDDIAECLELLKISFPHHEFPWSEKTRLVIAEEMRSRIGIQQHGHVELGKVISFMKKIKGRYRKAR